MKTKRIFALVLAVLTLSISLASCAKEEDKSKPVREVVEAPVNTPDGTEDDTVEYKEEFYFYNAGTHSQYMLGLTDTEYRLIRLMPAGEYRSDFVLTRGTYTVDGQGNYILERTAEEHSKLYFSEHIGGNSQFVTEIQPIVLTKSGDMYYDAAEELALVKQGASEGKLLWLGEYSPYQMNVTVGAAKPEKMTAYLVNKSTGVSESIELTAESFTVYDTSAVGDTTFKITYGGAEYEIAARVMNEGESVPAPVKNVYGELGVSDGLGAYVSKGTSFESYFEGYNGTDPLFWYGDGKTAVTDYKVDGWDTDKTADGERMFYSVSAKIGDKTYRYVGSVYVCTEEMAAKGELSDITVAENPFKTSDSGAWFVAKGSEIKGVTGKLTAINGQISEGVALTVEDCDTSKVGAQLISLKCEGATYGQVIYVYDESNAIVTDIELEGLKVNAEGTGVDYTDGKVKFTYCDGSERVMSIDGYKKSITETAEGTGFKLSFRYNAIAGDASYPMTVTVSVTNE